jgi:predicted nucleic acid-binding protein
MTDAFIDTNVIIRLLTNDDPGQRVRSRQLFDRVEQGTLRVTAPITVIADAVFVLASPRTYNIPRAAVAAQLLALVKLRNFRLKNRRAVVRALELYAATNLDFGDAFIAASMSESGATELYSYDSDFDRLRGIHRTEP